MPGLSGDIRLGNSYYDDLHRSTGAFDFVMANPPFNLNGGDSGAVVSGAACDTGKSIRLSHVWRNPNSFRSRQMCVRL